MVFAAGTEIYPFFYALHAAIAMFASSATACQYGQESSGDTLFASPRRGTEDHADHPISSSTMFDQEYYWYAYDDDDDDAEQRQDISSMFQERAIDSAESRR